MKLRWGNYEPWAGGQEQWRAGEMFGKHPIWKMSSQSWKSFFECFWWVFPADWHLLNLLFPLSLSLAPTQVFCFSPCSWNPCLYFPIATLSPVHIPCLLSALPHTCPAKYVAEAKAASYPDSTNTFSNTSITLSSPTHLSESLLLLYLLS